MEALAACGRWQEAAAALVSGTRSGAGSPDAAMGLMCNMARAAATHAQDAHKTGELVKTAHEARPSTPAQFGLHVASRTCHSPGGAVHT